MADLADTTTAAPPVEASATLVAANGLTVHVRIETTDHGPRLVLDPQGDCYLDGDVPGEYYLTEQVAR